MNSYYKLLLIISFVYALLNMVACNRNSNRVISETSSPSSQTSVAPEDIPYSGYRLELINIEVKKEKGNLLLVTGTIINTGRNKVVLPSKNANELVVKFDQSLIESGYLELSDAIRNRLLKQKISLEPGQMAYNTSLGVKKFIQPPSNSSQQEEVIAQQEEVIVQKEIIPEQELITQKKEIIAQQEEIITPKEEVKPILEDLTPKEEKFVEKGGDMEEEGCPDLVIESFSVTKRKKKYAEITYTIVNKGTAPAPLFGEEKAVDDNIAVRAYASGTAKLSRGDMILGGSFIEKGLKEQKGILQPNETYQGTFKIDIRKKTRHMPFLIMFVDTYQGIWECDEGNNVMNITYR